MCRPRPSASARVKSTAISGRKEEAGHFPAVMAVLLSAPSASATAMWCRSSDFPQSLPRSSGLSPFNKAFMPNSCLSPRGASATAAAASSTVDTTEDQRGRAGGQRV